MFWIILAAMLPFLVWLWLGIFFNIVLYVGAKAMEHEVVNEVIERARIVRYVDMKTPGLLSVLDKDRNILFIDREGADLLPQAQRERLEITDLPATRLVNSPFGLRFEATI